MIMIVPCARIIPQMSILILVLFSTIIKRSLSKICEDDSYYTFGLYKNADGKKIRRTCAWLTADPKKKDIRKSNWCNRQWLHNVIQDKCPETCDKCIQPSIADDTCTNFSPQEISPNNPSDWYDSGGVQYDCEFYAAGANCEIFGNGFQNFGWTARQACCVCGGGEKIQGPPTQGSCSDLSPRDLSHDNPMKWNDRTGANYDCEYYAVGDNCNIFGNGFANYGWTAKQACCACGGGRDQ